MRVPSHFEIGPDYAAFRPVGPASIETCIDRVSEAIAYACAQGVKRLLINITGLTDLPVASTADRYMMGKRFAEAATPGFRAVLVTQPERIDPRAFGVTVARNRGLDGHVSATESEALAWLLRDTDETGMQSPHRDASKSLSE